MHTALHRGTVRDIQIVIMRVEHKHIQTVQTRNTHRLTEISEHQSGRVGKVEWSGTSERSLPDRVICKPGSQPDQPSRLPFPSPSVPRFTDIHLPAAVYTNGAARNGMHTTTLQLKCCQCPSYPGQGACTLIWHQFVCLLTKSRKKTYSIDYHKI